MVTRRDLANGTPSGATEKSSPDYTHTLLPNGMVVHSTWGSLADGIEGAEHQRLIGQWEGTSAELVIRVDEGEFAISDADAKWYVGITTDNRLLLSVGKGRTPIGQIREDDDRSLLGFSWPYNDIGSIYVGRVKKVMKWWNEEVVITATDGIGRFRVGVLAPYVGTSARALSKAIFSPNAVVDSFVNSFGDAVSRFRDGAAPDWVVDRDRGEESWELKFTE